MCTTMTALAEEAPEISRIPARFRNSRSLLSYLQTLVKKYHHAVSASALGCSVTALAEEARVSGSALTVSNSSGLVELAINPWSNCE